MELLDRLQTRFPEHYRHGNILMIHGDCMDVMAEIKENEIPLAIVDPPYGIGMGGGKVGNSKKDYKQFAGSDSCIPNADYFAELKRISKHQIIWGGNYMIEHLEPTSCFLIWDKVQPEDFTMAMCEFAWTSMDTPAKIYKKRIVGADKDGRIHPTQKPVALYKWLLKNYAKPGDRILDTHGGSGSIVIACHDLGHPIIWVEKDADYYRDAVARYKTHASQQQLFTPSDVKQPDKQINLL